MIQVIEGRVIAEPSPEFAAQLGLSPGDEVVQFKRLFLLDDQPVALSRSRASSFASRRDIRSSSSRVSTPVTIPSLNCSNPITQPGRHTRRTRSESVADRLGMTRAEVTAREERVPSCPRGA